MTTIGNVLNKLKNYVKSPISDYEAAPICKEDAEVIISHLFRQGMTWTVWSDFEGKTRTCQCGYCGKYTSDYTWENPNFCSNCGCVAWNGGENDDDFDDEDEEDEDEEDEE